MSATVTESRPEMLQAEYNHFRFCGIDRPTILSRLAYVYAVSPDYLASILKEQK